jgi:hypothetical protein
MRERGVEHHAADGIVRGHQARRGAQRHCGEACPNQSATALIETPLDSNVDA